MAKEVENAFSPPQALLFQRRRAALASYQGPQVTANGDETIRFPARRTRRLHHPIFVGVTPAAHR